MDPVRPTIQHDWIWQNGGPYFGVPFSNFVPGWFLVVWVIFQLVALYLYHVYQPCRDTGRVSSNPSQGLLVSGRVCLRRRRSGRFDHPVDACERSGD